MALFKNYSQLKFLLKNMHMYIKTNVKNLSITYMSLKISRINKESRYAFTYFNQFLDNICLILGHWNSSN